MCKVNGSTSLSRAETINGTRWLISPAMKADVAAEAVELGDAHGNLRALGVLQCGCRAAAVGQRIGTLGRFDLCVFGGNGEALAWRSCGARRGTEAPIPAF